MGRAVGKNKRILIYIEGILLLTLTIFIFINLYISFLISNNHLYRNYKINTYVSKFDELNKKQKELESIKNNINTYKNIDDKIENIKGEFFKYAKLLEEKVSNNLLDKKIAYITFDDGPYYNTYKVLEILDKYDIKATFFTTSINGENCYDNRSQNCMSLYKEYIKKGHTIANHTYTHAIWKGLYDSEKSFIRAVKMQENLVKEKTDGYITNIVRFPGGSNTSRSLKYNIIEELENNNYGWVDWSAMDGDGGNLSSEDEAWKTFKTSIDDKIEVILLHDYSRITTNLLPSFIEYLEDNNYILLPLFYDSIVINK